MLLPRVIVLGGLLDVAECDELMELSRASLKRSTVLDAETGGDQVHGDRTSAGPHFARGGTALVSRTGARLARMLVWPVRSDAHTSELQSLMCHTLAVLSFEKNMD